jgi:hypothetical protein
MAAMSVLPAAVPVRAYVIQGRTVTMPVVVRDATSAAATYLVHAAAARRLLPPELDVVELLPGRALFSIACIQYRDNDLGDYNEVSLAFFVRRRDEPRGVPWLGAAVALVRNRLATWIWKLPVNQAFTCAAGRDIWGFPKTIEEITFTEADGRSSCRLVMDGRHVLTMGMARGGSRTLPDASMVTYTHIGGRLHRTAFASGAGGVGIHLGGVDLTLGDHPIADELRSLGLPRRALLGVWLGSMHGRFETPEACG